MFFIDVVCCLLPHVQDSVSDRLGLLVARIHMIDVNLFL